MAQKQLFVLRPDLKPRRHAGEAFVAMGTTHRPTDTPFRVDTELGLNQIKVDA